MFLYINSRLVKEMWEGEPCTSSEGGGTVFDDDGLFMKGEFTKYVLRVKELNRVAVRQTRNEVNLWIGKQSLLRK